MARPRLIPTSPLVHWLLFAVLLAATSRAGAAVPSENLLPATTKGFVSTRDVDQMRKAFNETQFGQLVNDPLMKAFVEDLKRQVGQKMEQAGKRLGLKWEDLEGVYGGEAATALVQPDPKDKMSHATVTIVDVTGKQAEVKQLLAKVDAGHRANGATRTTIKAGGVEMTVHTQRLKAGEKTPEKSYYFIRDDQLVVSDHLGVATGIAGRFGGQAKDSLATNKAFEHAMQRNEKAAAGEAPHVRWYLDPFGYLEVSRAVAGGRKKRGTDLLKILNSQGFAAVQGMGGYVFFGNEDTQILHRTFIYAPGPFHLAMRMFDFPNSGVAGGLAAEPWVMPEVATHLSCNWKMKEAFDHSETLVDAIVGDKGVFKEIWLSLKTDPNGPKIDIYKGLVNHLGGRANLISDLRFPVGTKSERLMGVIEVTAPDIVAKTVEDAFKNDPQARKRMVAGHAVWEVSQEEEIAEAELTIEGAGFPVSAEAVATPTDDEAKLPNMAITVYQGYLVVATHVDFIEELLTHTIQAGHLAQGSDYQRVQDALTKLGAGQDSFRYFTRTEKSFHVTYELLRQGKLPEGETMLARLLNNLFGPEEEGVIRKQAIDGTKMPEYDEIKKYLGSGGVFAQTEADGWWIVGCFLKK